MKKLRKSSPKKKCPYCNELFDARGCKNHIRLKHLIKVQLNDNNELSSINTGLMDFKHDLKKPAQPAAQEVVLNCSKNDITINNSCYNEVEFEAILAKLIPRGEQRLIFCPLCPMSFCVSNYSHFPASDMKHHLTFKHGSQFRSPGRLDKLLNEDQMNRLMVKTEDLLKKKVFSIVSILK